MCPSLQSVLKFLLSAGSSFRDSWYLADLTKKKKKMYHPWVVLVSYTITVQNPPRDLVTIVA